MQYWDQLVKHILCIPSSISRIATCTVCCLSRFALAMFAQSIQAPNAVLRLPASASDMAFWTATLFKRLLRCSCAACNQDLNVSLSSPSNMRCKVRTTTLCVPFFLRRLNRASRAKTTHASSAVLIAPWRAQRPSRNSCFCFAFFLRLSFAHRPHKMSMVFKSPSIAIITFAKIACCLHCSPYPAHVLRAELNCNCLHLQKHVWIKVVETPSHHLRANSAFSLPSRAILCQPRKLVRNSTGSSFAVMKKRRSQHWTRNCFAWRYNSLCSFLHLSPSEACAAIIAKCRQAAKPL
mmetsp:Transcript_119956/g.188177  ORF Transcript_119956/g.188177 Transcript_119956/m.188177 type:complete len:293 (-) Transcript_119956:1521-2399(-)